MSHSFHRLPQNMRRPVAEPIPRENLIARFSAAQRMRRLSSTEYIASIQASTKSENPRHGGGRT